MVRRISVFLVAGALLLVLIAGVAMARTFQCGKFAYPCTGTDKPDVISERQGNSVQDDISALAGSDIVRAHLYGRDNDVVQGDRGADRIRTDDRDDRDAVDCGESEEDVAIVDEGDVVNFSNCETVRGQSDGGEGPPPLLVASDPGQDASRAVLPE